MNEKHEPDALEVSTRPQELQTAILKAYERVHKRNAKWMYNGTSPYDLLDIDEYKFIKTLILTNPNRKNFYI